MAFDISLVLSHSDKVSPWMDNGTSISYVKKFPTVDRLKILAEVASGSYDLTVFHLALFEPSVTRPAIPT